MKQLDQTTALKLLKKYKIKITPSTICQNLSECLAFAKKHGFPIVLKIDSPDVIHKSDIGAVKTNILTNAQLKKSYSQIIKNVGKVKINGMLIQKQVLGHNLLVGMKKDPQFGPVIIVGMGGTLVELIKDISKRIAPISIKDAKEMLKELKSYKILEGYRGDKGINLNKLIDIVLSLSHLSLHEEVEEIDFNPVICNEKECFVVDTRIITK